MERLKIGIVGCGNISGRYFQNCKKFANLEVAACADLDAERARAKAAEFGVPRACTVEEMLADPSIGLILNLTIPKAHAEVNERILAAGKHVYTEKPLGLSKKEVEKCLKLAKEKNLFMGCAPDTVLGAGIQTCRKIIDEGWIGEPVAATAFMMCHGHESWHPDPEFYYQKGGGPMFDMGPYYLTALVTLLGPVKKLAGMAKISFTTRTITSEKKFGKKFDVEIPTFVSGIMEFKNGAVGTIITTFDVWAHQMPFIEIYGSRATLRMPDPNNFGGLPQIKTQSDTEWRAMPLSHGFQENSRGIGVSDLADSLFRKRKTFRANGEIAYHVLDIMESLHVSSEKGGHITLSSACERPQPMPVMEPKLEPEWFNFNS